MSDRKIPFQFAPIAHAALDAAEKAKVSAGAQGCYVHICRHASAGIARIGHARLAQRLHCSEVTVAKYISELVEAKLIQVEVKPGCCNTYLVMAWLTPQESEDVLEPPVEEQPIKAVPIPDQGSEGSDSDPEPPKKPEGVRKRIERIAGVWTKRTLERAEGLLRKRTEQVPIKYPSSTEQVTEQDPSKSIPEPVEPPVALAAAAGAPRQAPPEKEQPRPVVEPGQTWGELFGTPEPSPDEALAAGKKLILDSIKLAPEGQWRYNEQILSTEALLAYPRIRAVITPEDLAEHRKANELSSFRRVRGC